MLQASGRDLRLLVLAAKIVFGRETVTRLAPAAQFEQSECRCTLAFDCVSVADGRQPAGFASFTSQSPDGSRRTANKVSATWLATDN